MQLEKNFILKKAKKMNPTVNVFEKIEKKVGKSTVIFLLSMGFCKLKVFMFILNLMTYELLDVKNIF